MKERVMSFFRAAMSSMGVVVAAAVTMCAGCASRGEAEGQRAAQRNIVVAEVDEVTEIMPLQHVDATGAAAHLNAQQPQRVRIIAEPAQNALIIVGARADVAEMQASARNLDQPAH